MRVRVHVVASAWGYVLDVAEAKRSVSILIALELGDGGFGSSGTVETNDTGATRSTARLVLYLRLLDLADGGEQLNQVLVACGPRKLVNDVSTG